MEQSTLQAITQIQSLIEQNNNENIAFQICLDVLNASYQAKLPEKDAEIETLQTELAAAQAQILPDPNTQVEPTP